MSNETVTLPVRCPKCGQAVALTYTPEDTYRDATWRCPYTGCQSVHRLEIRGSGLWAVARYEPPKG